MKTFLAIFLMSFAVAGAQPATELWSRGYSVIPEPQNVRLSPGDVQIDPHWKIDASGLAPQHIALKTLRRDLREFHAIELRGENAAAPVVRLAVAPGSVRTGTAPEIDKQAYRLAIGEARIEITGNSDQGLFYGVQTLTQLLRRDGNGRLLAPAGVIEDWPKLELRMLHWDTKHHQDRMETLKRYLDWSARFKANMIGFELEDKFQYPSHPSIGAPGAFTTAQLQEIVDYGRERFVQVVPQIQAPAHMAYVLKHPEFADLRADGNNYQSTMCDPRTYDLIFSMYDDIIKATKGVDYFFVSTDEVYYAGIESKCDKPYNLVNRSLKWVEFVQRAHDFFKTRNRRLLLWVEYPVLPEHIKLLPPDVIDNIIGNTGYIEPENQLGVRQMAYTSMQGEEFLFPNHLSLGGQEGVTEGRLTDAYNVLLSGKQQQGHPIGAFGAAWSDAGLHNETFWLGWSAVAQWAWNPGAVSVEQHASAFMRTYYGPHVSGMVENYRMLELQARQWQNAWDRTVSKARRPGYGNSRGKGVGTTRYDLTLQPLPLPALPALSFDPSFADRYRTLIAAAGARSLDNARLAQALTDNFPLADRNRYNLEVLLALTNFIGHHWRLLEGLSATEQLLENAQRAADGKNATAATAALLGAYGKATGLQKEFEKTFGDLKAVFEKGHFPKGQSVDGRSFVHVLDDTKDHWGDRRADLTYMTAPEESLGLDGWRKELLRITREYASQNRVDLKSLNEVIPGE
jgi:hexosaminidase